MAVFNLINQNRFSDIDDNSLNAYTESIVGLFPRSGNITFRYDTAFLTACGWGFLCHVIMIIIVRHSQVKFTFGICCLFSIIRQTSTKNLLRAIPIKFFRYENYRRRTTS